MIKLIQISDCHIDDQALAMGVDTQTNLAKVVKKISNLKFEALLISGDLSNSGSLYSYKRLKEILLPIQQPTYVFGGNHDNIDQLIKEFNDNLFNYITLGKWSVITIDSVQLHKTSGLVTEEALETLNQTLKSSTADYIMVALHHPIVSMNSSWNDELSLENPQDLFKILNKHSKIRCVIFGHAHEAAHFSHEKFDIVSCPSTALQFTQDTRIGFNEYQLHDNGKINWQTQWI
jgi:3',5'-cyclic-AMP phosphodiesterase